MSRTLPPRALLFTLALAGLVTWPPPAPLLADEPAQAAAAPDEDEDAVPPAEGKKPEEKDPSDVRNAIGDMSLVRGFQRLTKPVKKGTWQDLVNQPYYTPAVRAKKLLFFGQYEDAELKFAELRKTSPDKQDLIEGHLEAILHRGHLSDLQRYNDELAKLNDAQRSTARMVRLRAEALVLAGRTPEARSTIRAFVDMHPAIDANDGETITTVMQYAGLLEDDAEYAAASGIYLKLLDLAEGKLPEDPQAATQLALALYRSARLSGTGKEKNRSVMFQLSQVREKDATYWPAILAEAEILLAAHNVNPQTGAPRALAELESLNPNEVEGRFLAVDQAIDNYSFESARTLLTELKDRTDSAKVVAYEGRLLLKERLPEKAVAPLLRALERDPQLAKARGWLAGAYFLLSKPDRMREQLAQARLGGGRGGVGADAEIHPAALYECAEILRDARQFTTAEGMYLQAQSRAAWWSEPPAALAELYLEMGEEDKAKTSLDRAFALDPYNMRALNKMTLLGILQKFATKESTTRLAPGSDKPAFIVRFDRGGGDEILADLVMEWMEKVRPEVWGYFGVTEMPAPTIIELFPSHEQFGVRTTGLPWIGTVGASTGNVIAMDVPRGGAKNMMGAFDWARVLRHEYTHTVTLALTNNRIPHWLTEAAAVNQEESPRDWDDAQLLWSNFRAGQLFKVADLNWGFIRPKRSIDRQLAYMESQWLYEYLVQTYGQPKMISFLHCFRDGMTEEQAWAKNYGKKMEEMDTEFLAWAKQQLEAWGLPADPLPKRSDVDAALKKNADDVDALYQLSMLLASAGDNKGAQKNLEKLLALDAKHLKGRELLGGVLNALKEKDKARAMLEEVVKDNPKRPFALRTLGLMAMSAKDFDSAEKWFMQLQAVRPLEQTSYTNLAGIYLVRGDRDKAIGQLLELSRHEQRDERIPRKLADLYLEAKDYADAESAAYRAIRINPYNAVNHQVMAQILVADKRPGQAVTYWTRATDLQPRVAEFWEGLADAQGALGKREAAAAAAKKAVELQPSSKASRWMQ
jgi:tetratricopeptide (TPR) repeat protein